MDEIEIRNPLIFGGPGPQGFLIDREVDTPAIDLWYDLPRTINLFRPHANRPTLDNRSSVAVLQPANQLGLNWRAALGNNTTESENLNFAIRIETVAPNATVGSGGTFRLGNVLPNTQAPGTTRRVKFSGFGLRLMIPIEASGTGAGLQQVPITTEPALENGEQPSLFVLPAGFNTLFQVGSNLGSNTAVENGVTATLRVDDVSTWTDQHPMLSTWNAPYHPGPAKIRLVGRLSLSGSLPNRLDRLRETRWESWFTISAGQQAHSEDPIRFRQNHFHVLDLNGGPFKKNKDKKTADALKSALERPIRDIVQGFGSAFSESMTSVLTTALGGLTGQGTGLGFQPGTEPRLVMRSVDRMTVSGIRGIVMDLMVVGYTGHEDV